MRTLFKIVAGLSLLLAAAPARGEPRLPDLIGALAAIAESGASSCGDALLAAASVAAGTLATTGDALSLLDRNRWTSEWRLAPLSGPPQAAAFGLAWSGAHALELLRREDIERLPRPSSDFIRGTAFKGPGAILADGLQALRLSGIDARGGLGQSVARLLRASRLDDRLRRWRNEGRDDALGPVWTAVQAE